MLHVLVTIVVGFVAGLLARALKPGDDKLGIAMTTLLGIAGSLGAKLLGEALGWYQPGDKAGLIASVLGAIALLVIAHAVRRLRSGQQPS